MILGIDLGTTYSVGAYKDENGEIRIIDNSEGSAVTPSVVLFDKGKNIVVGEVAKDNAVIRPQDVVSVVKNYMGKKKVLKEWEGNEYTPEIISSFIVRKLVQDAESYSGKTVDGVVVTVPAYFTDAQRKATEDAVTLAGVSLAGMINEPTAAALCYIEEHHIEKETILVYDLGGGTFDVTVLHVDGGNITVKSTGGLSNAGGRFFDQYIVDYVREYLEEKHGIDLENDEYVDELQELYQKAETAKLHLSSKTSTYIILKIGKIKEQIEITREMFENMIARIYKRTEGKIKDVLKEAGLTPADIGKVLLVGGSSRIPYIANAIESYMGQEISREVNPDEAVAIGAAIYADILSQDNNNECFIDVCSHSIGVVVIENGKEENEILIPKNSSLPVENMQRFRTIVKNQRMISLTVTEGEYKEITDVTEIGTFEIELPEGLKEQALILLKIRLDGQQLIHIDLELPDVGFKEEYQMKRIANMDEGMVANITGMLRDYTVN